MECKKVSVWLHLSSLRFGPLLSHYWPSRCPWPSKILGPWKVRGGVDCACEPAIRCMWMCAIWQCQTGGLKFFEACLHCACTTPVSLVYPTSSMQSHLRPLAGSAKCTWFAAQEKLTTANSCNSSHLSASLSVRVRKEAPPRRVHQLQSFTQAGNEWI